MQMEPFGVPCKEEMASALWIQAEQEIRDRLEHTEGIELHRDDRALEIAAPAFKVWMTDEESELIVWAGEHWHEHFEDPEAAANCLCWLLTPFYRLVEDYEDDTILEAFIERFWQGEWEEMSGGPVYVERGTQVRANRRVIRQHAVLSPGAVEELDEWLDHEGLPPDSELGVREVEVDRLIGISPEELKAESLFEDDDPMFGELLDALHDEEGPYDLTAGENWFEVKPHAEDSFAVRVERVGKVNRVIARGAIYEGEPMEVASQATLFLRGFARVVEEYAGDRLKSVTFECYGPGGWSADRLGPRYASWLARLWRTTERRYWQQRVEMGLEVVPQGDVDLDDGGWPRDSRWGCHREPVP
jgi:hypothetical protein